jgi:radical SAM superfamily enzyme YgiQ (UPF0313 family)
MTKQLDVLFVHPGASDIIYQGLSERFSAIETPTWSLLLAQSCRSKGFGVGLLDCDAERLSYDQGVQRIKEANPKLVCFVVYGSNPNAGTTRMTGAVGLAQRLKDTHPEYKVCFVGSHVSALPNEVLSYKCVDIVLLNEGVYALHNLLKTDLETDLQNVKGIGYKKQGFGVLNEPQGVVPQDRMDHDLPGSAWDLLPYKNKPFDLYRSCNWHANFHDELRTPYAALYTSLGCRFKCDFCLDEDTEIVVSNGRNKKIKNVTKQDKLLAFDTEKLEITETEIEEIASRSVSELLEIEFSDGKKVKATAEHPFYVSGKWVDAGDLKIGDQCLVIDSSDKRSFFAKHYNSAKKPGVVEKGWRTKLAQGFVPYMSTDEGRNVIATRARTRALSKDNPMHKESNRLKASLRMRGCKNPAWQGGISTMYQQYPVEFSTYLKRKVKKRDSYICQECGINRKGKKLDVHHIDYDKNNNVMCNLICLCPSCHTKTNYGREQWTLRYREKMLCYTNCPHYVSVAKITKLEGKFRVYNFRCGPHNNFFANYVLTHNCMINIVNRTDNSDGITSANSPGMRFWSPEFMLKEFETLQNFGVNTIRLSDEMFFLDKRYFEPLLKGLVERGYGKNLLMWAYARVDTVREKYLDLFRNAGVHWLALGIESSDQAIRKEITKGTYQETNIRDIVKQITNSGISVIANYIFGLPDDTYESMGKTLDLALELNTEMANMYPCFALPGSPLHHQAVLKGIELPQTPEAWSFHSYEAVPLPTKTLSAAEVLRFRDRAWQMYFTRPEYLSKVESRFGVSARQHIEDMTKVKLRRKLLGD